MTSSTDPSPPPVLDAAAQTCLRCIAGHMIPADPGLGVPAADDPGIVARMLASLNRDATALGRALALVDAAAGGSLSDLAPHDQAALLARLRAADRGALVVVESVVARAYYRDDRVLRSLGLEARPPFPAGYDLDGSDWSLLDPVRARGPIHREVPPDDDSRFASPQPER